MACVITSPGTECDEGPYAGPIDYTKGKTYSIRHTGSGSPGPNTRVTCGIKLTSDTDSFIITGGINDNWTFGSDGYVPSTHANTSVQTDPTSTENYQTVSWTALDMYVLMQVPAGGSDEWDISIQESDVDQLVVNLGPAETSGNVSGTENLAADSWFYIELHPTGDPDDPGYLTWSIGATVP
jgi:hypothetical protein